MARNTTSVLFNSTGTAMAVTDGTAIPDETSSILVAGEDPDGVAGHLQIDQDKSLLVNVPGGVLPVSGTVAVSGTVPISAASALPVSGTVAVSGTVPISAASALPVSGTVAVSGTVPISAASALPVSGTVAVSGTVPISAASALPVSATVLPLPTGAATETTLAARLDTSTFTTRIPVVGQKVSAGSIPVVLPSDQTVPVSGTVAVSGTVPISAASALSVSGTVGISGTVPVSGTVAVSGTVPVSGTVAVSGTVPVSIAATVPVSVAATLPVSIAATVNVAAPSALAMFPQKQTTANVTSVAAAITSGVVLASNAARSMAIFYNDSTAIAYLKFGTGASTTSFTYLMNPGDTIELPSLIYTGVLHAIWLAAVGSMRVTEVSP